MRLAIRSPLTLLAVLAALRLAPAPAAAQVEANAENAITCALIYRYMGDRGAAYEQLLARNAQLTGRTIDAVRADIDEREPRLTAAVSDGRLATDQYESLVTNTCPKTFGVAPARLGAKPAAAPSGQPDPVRCVALFRWFDRTYRVNSWGTTWAGDEMARRGASAAGLSYAAMEQRTGGYVFDNRPVSALLDQAVQCQQAYDTPVPPGAVVAAAQHGDRPGLDRGRDQYCQSLANDFDKAYPDLGSVQRAILNNPPRGTDQASVTMNELQFSLKAMEKAACPARFAQPRIDAFATYAETATSAVRQVKARLEREGKWW